MYGESLHPYGVTVKTEGALGGLAEPPSPPILPPVSLLICLIYYVFFSCVDVSVCLLVCWSSMLVSSLVCLSVHTSICLFIGMSAMLSVCLLVQYVCLFVCKHYLPILHACLINSIPCPPDCLGLDKSIG